MNWLTTTYDEIEARLRTKVPTLKAVDLFNNQFDDLKDERLNEEYPWDFPCCFIAFGGGTWERQPGGERLSRDYEIRLHVGSYTYDESREHLETLTAYANALDGWTGTNVKMEFVRDRVDDQRQNVIEHVLTFTCTVCDDSMLTDNPVTYKKAESKHVTGKIESL